MISTVLDLTKAEVVGISVKEDRATISFSDACSGPEHYFFRLEIPVALLNEVKDKFDNVKI